MSDMDTLIMNADVVDMDSKEVCGEVVGYEREGHKLLINIVLNEDYVYIEDDDDPEKEDIPEEEPEVKTKAKGKSIADNIRQLKTGTEGK